MAKVHNIGQRHFFQNLGFYPALWGKRLWVKGWTQEIEFPFRSANTFIVRLPFNRAVAFGKWSGQLDEEEALNRAIQGRVLRDEDFEEGWTAPAYQAGTTSFEDWDV
jgi:hypothetical protein